MKILQKQIHQSVMIFRIEKNTIQHPIRNATIYHKNTYANKSIFNFFKSHTNLISSLISIFLFPFYDDFIISFIKNPEKSYFTKLLAIHLQYKI